MIAIDLVTSISRIGSRSQFFPASILRERSFMHRFERWRRRSFSKLLQELFEQCSQGRLIL